MWLARSGRPGELLRQLSYRSSDRDSGPPRSMVGLGVAAGVGATWSQKRPAEDRGQWANHEMMADTSACLRPVIGIVLVADRDWSGTASVMKV
jgi:hypothetical protein